MKKKSVNIVIQLIIGLLLGFILGFMGIKFIKESVLSQQSGIEIILNLGGVFIYLIIGMFLQIVLHELGHLLFGKLTGYDFVSFRIGNIMFIKKNDKLVKKKFNIVGTDGQCLMSPPEPVNGKFPYILYNLGGSFANFISSGLCYLIYLLLSGSLSAIAIMFIVLSSVGIFLGLINIIPLKAFVANDGFNTLTLYKDEKARGAFWLQLRINALTTQGVRYRDMPAEWFPLPSDGDLNDVISISTAIYRFNYLIDKQEFKEAKTLAEYLLTSTDKMLEIHKNELRCELLFLEIIGECRKEEIDRLYTKQLEKYIKKTSDYVSRQRLLYAYSRLVSHDKAQAEKAYKQFLKTCATYPYAADIAGESELINLIDSMVIN